MYVAWLEYSTVSSSERDLVIESQAMGEYSTQNGNLMTMEDRGQEEIPSGRVEGGPVRKLISLGLKGLPRP